MKQILLWLNNFIRNFSRYIDYQLSIYHVSWTYLMLIIWRGIKIVWQFHAVTKFAYINKRWKKYAKIVKVRIRVNLICFNPFRGEECVNFIIYRVGKQSSSKWLAPTTFPFKLGSVVIINNLPPPILSKHFDLNNYYFKAVSVFFNSVECDPLFCDIPFPINASWLESYFCLLIYSGWLLPICQIWPSKPAVDFCLARD